MASVPPHGLFSAAFGLAMNDPGVFRELSLIQHVHPRFATLEGARRALFSDRTPDAVVAKHFARMQPESQRAIFDMSWLHLRVRTPAAPVPMLVLGAEDDAFFPPPMIETTARVYGTRAEIFPDMAHAMMLEAGWESVAGRIKNWLYEKGL